MDPCSETMLANVTVKNNQAARSRQLVKAAFMLPVVNC